jgi:LPXTG-motif cell wall-anchored protein
MKNVVKYVLSATVLTLTLSSQAFANEKGRQDSNWWDHKDKIDCANTAPEVDPSLAIGGLTLLGGTLTVLRSRRRK